MPLWTSEERFLACKTLFLLALASAKWIGELHALSHRISHSGDWGEVSFTFVAGFVAKTQDPSSSAPPFEGFTVLALPNTSINRNGRLLCPVRVVRCYLDHTAAHHLRCERLCSSPQDVARRRSPRTRSPSGSGRRYLGRTSSRGDPFRILLRELGRPRVSLHLFSSRRALLSTRC